MIRTQRLILRAWLETDFEPFAKLCADPRVMECFPALLTRQESDHYAQRFQKLIEDQGWGLWAVTVPGIVDSFIGFIGLNPIQFASPFTPAVEVGWRLAYDFWGQGYATEGALAALNYGFEMLDLDEIVAITVPANQRSRHVMEKIGMHRDRAGDFDHPLLSEGHKLKRHVLYRLGSSEWHKRASGG